jgi:hypothetical protein
VLTLLCRRLHPLLLSLPASALVLLLQVTGFSDKDSEAIIIALSISISVTQITR